jgi:hypothetical protein
MMVGPVEHPRHRTVTALRSRQLSLSFSALICHWPPAQNAAVRPAIAAIRAERSILSAQTSVCWTECFFLRLGKWLPSEDVPKTVVFERSVQTQRKSAKSPL